MPDGRKQRKAEMKKLGNINDHSNKMGEELEQKSVREDNFSERTKNNRLVHLPE